MEHIFPEKWVNFNEIHGRNGDSSSNFIIDNCDLRESNGMMGMIMGI